MKTTTVFDKVTRLKLIYPYLTKKYVELETFKNAKVDIYASVDNILMGLDMYLPLKDLSKEFNLEDNKSKNEFLRNRYHFKCKLNNIEFTLHRGRIDSLEEEVCGLFFCWDEVEVLGGVDKLEMESELLKLPPSSSQK